MTEEDLREVDRWILRRLVGMTALWLFLTVSLFFTRPAVVAVTIGLLFGLFTASLWLRFLMQREPK